MASRRDTAPRGEGERGWFLRNRQGIATVSLFAVAALLLGYGTGSIPLLDPDESRFARTSLEMLRSGDPVVPVYEGQPRLVKPPLLHWMQAALFASFGVSERVARLPSFLATLAALLLTGWIAHRRFGPEGALWAIAVLGSMPLVVALGRLGTLDALLALHVLAAVALDIAEPDETGGRRALAIGAILGLAFLIKGPVGVVLPLLIMLAGRTAAGRELLPRRVKALEALAGFSVVALPWVLAFLSRVGPAAAWEVVRREAITRYIASADHVEPGWFYLSVIGAGMFPWIAPVILGMGRALFRWGDPGSRTAQYTAAGFLAGLIFFSAGSSKLASYLLPLAPLAAVLATWELGQELDESRERMRGPLLLWMVLGALALGLGLASGLGLRGIEAVTAVSGAGIYGLAFLIALGGLLTRRPRVVWAASAAASGAFLMLVVAFVHPEIARNRTAAVLVEAVPGLHSGGRPVVMIDMKVPSLTFYLDRIPEEVDLADLDERLETTTDDPMIVFDRDDLARATQSVRSRLNEVGRAGKYVVMERKQETPPAQEEGL